MKKICLLVWMAIFIASVSSCGSLSRMSYEDAYNTGYHIGAAARALINN